jgi:hypothetical protein
MWFRLNDDHVIYTEGNDTNTLLLGGKKQEGADSRAAGTKRQKQKFEDSPPAALYSRLSHTRKQATLIEFHTASEGCYITNTKGEPHEYS